MHQAAQPVFLLDRALGAQWNPDAVRLQLSLSPQELAEGRAAVERALAPKAHASSPDRRAAPFDDSAPAQNGRSLTADRAFGFFAHATGHKTIGGDYWRAFWDAFLALEPQALPVEVLPSPDAAPTDPRCATVQFHSPRALAAAIGSMRLFLCADTGPMHLASATDVPTVALFQASDPALYGPLKPRDIALDLSRFPPADAAARCREIWRSASDSTPAGCTPDRAPSSEAPRRGDTPE
jgi:hypothetical protein